MASSRRVGGTALACTVQDHLVFGDPQRHVLADATQLAFESLVGERIEPPANGRRPCDGGGRGRDAPARSE